MIRHHKEFLIMAFDIAECVLCKRFSMRECMARRVCWLLHLASHMRPPAPLCLATKDLLIPISRAARLIQGRLGGWNFGGAVWFCHQDAYVSFVRHARPPARLMPCCWGRQRGVERLVGGRRDNSHPLVFFLSFFLSFFSIFLSLFSMWRLFWGEETFLSRSDKACSEVVCGLHTRLDLIMTVTAITNKSTTTHPFDSRTYKRVV